MRSAVRTYCFSSTNRFKAASSPAGILFCAVLCARKSFQQSSCRILSINSIGFSFPGFLSVSVICQGDYTTLPVHGKSSVSGAFSDRYQEIHMAFGRTDFCMVWHACSAFFTYQASSLAGAHYCALYLSDAHLRVQNHYTRCGTCGGTCPSFEIGRINEALLDCGLRLSR